MITTEENAECWIDQFDALLMVNTPSTGGRRIIPLLPAVYGGRIVTFGFQYMSADDIPKSLPFRAKMARAFLLGRAARLDQRRCDHGRQRPQRGRVPAQPGPCPARRARVPADRGGSWARRRSPATTRV